MAAEAVAIAAAVGTTVAPNLDKLATLAADERLDLASVLDPQKVACLQVHWPAILRFAVRRVAAAVVVFVKPHDAVRVQRWQAVRRACITPTGVEGVDPV